MDPEFIQDISRKYEELFRGSARLGLMLGAHGIEWTRVVPYLERFSEELTHFQELGVTSHDQRATIRSTGVGQNAAHRFTSLMQTHGVAEDRLRRFLVRASAMEHGRMLLGMQLFDDGTTGFDYVLRQRHDLELASAMLVDAGYDDLALMALRRCTEVLGCEDVHAYSCGEHVEGDSSQSVFFRLTEDIHAWDHVQKLCDEMGIDASFAENLNRCQAGISAPNMVSLRFMDPSAAPVLELSFTEARPTLFAPLFEGVSYERAYASRVDGLRSYFQNRRLHRFVLQLNADGLCGSMATCAVFGGEDEPVAEAD
jgi:hypothetical protein